MRIPTVLVAVAAAVALAVPGCTAHDRCCEDDTPPLMPGHAIDIRFSRSIDVAWFASPKLAAGQQADFVLSPDTATGLPGAAFLVLDPGSVRPAGSFDGPCAPGDRIVSGEVTATAPLIYEPAGTEHEPEWAEAAVLVVAVVCDQP